MEHTLHKVLNDQEFVAWYYNAYDSKSIEQLSAGELREALSFYYHTKSDNSLINRILDAVKYNTSLTWSQPELSLVDQAYLVKLLREAGYELPLFERFPNNSFDLRSNAKQIKPVTSIEKILLRLKDLKRRCVEEQHYFGGAFILTGLIYFSNWNLFLWSIFLTWALWAVVEFPKHDYFEHRYVEPRNRFIEYVVDFMLYALHPIMYADRLHWITLHTNHHKHWKSEKDFFTQASNNFIVTLKTIFAFKFLLKPDNIGMERILEKHAGCSWIFKYLVEIRIAVFSLVIFLAGFENFFYLLLLPITSKMIFDGQHDWFLGKFGERNYWFLFPLSLNQSWHLYHHENYRTIPRTWNDIFLGPWWVKYINPQYYVARLLFKFRD